MQIRPNDFWEMSLYEFLHAIDGFVEFHSSQENAPLSKAELHDLMERYPD